MIIPQTEHRRGVLRVAEQAERAHSTEGPAPLIERPRRLRRTPGLRRMLRETTLDAADFIYPLFVVHGSDTQAEIGSMPGNYHWSLDKLPVEAEAIARLGLPAVLLFG